MAAPPCPLPSRLGDDHLGADLVEALPELGALQIHARRLRRGQRRAGPGALGGAAGGGGRGARQESLLAAACGESGGAIAAGAAPTSPSGCPSAPAERPARRQRWPARAAASAPGKGATRAPGPRQHGRAARDQLPPSPPRRARAEAGAARPGCEDGGAFRLATGFCSAA